MERAKQYQNAVTEDGSWDFAKVRIRNTEYQNTVGPEATPPLNYRKIIFQIKK